MRRLFCWIFGHRWVRTPQVDDGRWLRCERCKRVGYDENQHEVIAPVSG